MSLICGPCAVGRHTGCTGFLRTELAFCPCATRDHADKPPADHPSVLERNEAILLEHVRQTLHAGEA